MIKFYNTLEGKLEDFKPLKEGEVSLYTCGPTVYDFAHIGNFRTFIFEDLLRRFLEFKGYKVNHVMNITDVDDKTIAGAQKEKKSLDEFTKKYTDAFNEDLKTLNILAPAKQPHATHEIPAMVELIKKLIANGAAYEKDGSVYYRVASFPNYGKLSKKDLKGNIKGARVDVDEYEKEEGSDFALWKKAKENEPSWDSPWGRGRPGWHIECSVMSMKYLGDTFDIHAGGEDLIFPHHENEIAQSEAATKKTFVKYWLHSKHLLVNGEKMSKSKGNYYALRDLLQKGYDPMAIRYALLSVHYRQQLNFTLDGLKEADEVIRRLQDSYKACLTIKRNVKVQNRVRAPWQQDLTEVLKQALEDLEHQALDNDLNISMAFRYFFDGIREINYWLSNRGEDFLAEKRLNAVFDFFKKADQLFGLNITCLEDIPEELESILQQYEKFRNEKNFEQSDKLRKEIERKGWVVKDGRPGEPSVLVKK